MEEFIHKFEYFVGGEVKGQVRPETCFRDLSYWDSMCVLSLLSMVELDYRKQLTADEIKSCITVSDLYQMIVGKPEKSPE